MNALLEARTLLHRLGLSGRGFTSEILLERLDSRLGIGIVAVPDSRLPTDGISGACITTNGSHVVFYPAGASDRLQLAIICHECAHLLLRHRGRSINAVLTGTDPPSPADELAAEALGAALVHFAERPERWPLRIRGTLPSGPAPQASALGARLRRYFRPARRSHG